MSIKIGFVLLTHNNPHQAVRLVRKLNYMFDMPPITWHHDFTQCNLPLDSITKNVYLVRPHFQTSWSTFTIVDAMMGALTALFESKNPPDWFILLSGADYPIKKADKIVHDLSISQYDVHIHHEKIRYNNHVRDWQELCYKRYCSLRLTIPYVDRRLKPSMRTIRLTSPLVAAPFLPFSKTFSCFAGEHWFCSNQLAAEYLIDYHRTKPALGHHYRRLCEYRIRPEERLIEDTICPEESYYHTIFCNSQFLRISQNHWRYIDWPGSGAHPRTLMMKDLSKLHESTAHFARKFDANIDSKVLDALDTVT